jgi:hypothetical protein
MISYPFALSLANCSTSSESSLTAGGVSASNRTHVPQEELNVRGTGESFGFLIWGISFLKRIAPKWE